MREPHTSPCFPGHLIVEQSPWEPDDYQGQRPQHFMESPMMGIMEGDIVAIYEFVGPAEMRWAGNGARLVRLM